MESQGLNATASWLLNWENSEAHSHCLFLSPSGTPVGHHSNRLENIPFFIPFPSLPHFPTPLPVLPEIIPNKPLVPNSQTSTTWGWSLEGDI